MKPLLCTLTQCTVEAWTKYDALLGKLLVTEKELVQMAEQCGFNLLKKCPEGPLASLKYILAQSPIFRNTSKCKCYDCDPPGSGLLGQSQISYSM